MNDRYQVFVYLLLRFRYQQNLLVPKTNNFSTPIAITVSVTKANTKVTTMGYSLAPKVVMWYRFIHSSFLNSIELSSLTSVFKVEKPFHLTTTIIVKMTTWNMTFLFPTSSTN